MSNAIDKFDWREVELEEAINWNNVDPFDIEIWNRLIENFWVPERIPLADDIQSWGTLTEEEKLSTVRVFAGLTLLDTIQGKIGAISLMPDARSPHEEAIYTNIAFMEQIHAKSYSSIFSTLISTEEINEAFRWSKNNEFLKKKAAIILHYYRGDDPEKRKIASTLLESFLFYSGFFMPLWWETKQIIPNSADIIRLIIRDEAIHGHFIGAKFQQAFKESSVERQNELRDFANDLLHDLYENELRYTEQLYDPLGITEHVKVFIRYNAVKAFQNLGLEDPFESKDTEVLPQILASLDHTNSTNQDMFSSTGTYVMKADADKGMSDDEWGDLFGS